MFSIRRSLAAGGIALLSLVGGLGAGGTAQASATPTPFRATFAGQATFIETSTDGVYAGTGVGRGHATHLGAVGVAVTETLVISPSGQIALRDGRMTMTAANGDVLRWTYSATGTPPDANGDVVLTGVYTVTGGTGRFVDASGHGTFTGVGSVVTGKASLSYTGVLSR